MKFERKNFVCQECQESFTQEILQIANVDAIPELRDKVKNLSFFILTCPHCGATVLNNNFMIYLDSELGLTAAMTQTSEEARALANDAKFLEDAKNSENRHRVVVGQLRLSELVMICEAGLDDYVMGMLRKKVLAYVKKKHPEITNIYFDGMKDDELVMQCITSNDVLDSYQIPKAIYDLLLEKHKKEFPNLSRNSIVFVDMDNQELEADDNGMAQIEFGKDLPVVSDGFIPINELEAAIVAKDKSEIIKLIANDKKFTRTALLCDLKLPIAVASGIIDALTFDMAVYCGTTPEMRNEIADMFEQLYDNFTDEQKNDLCGSAYRAYASNMRRMNSPMSITPATEVEEQLIRAIKENDEKMIVHLIVSEGAKLNRPQPLLEPEIYNLSDRALLALLERGIGREHIYSIFWKTLHGALTDLRDAGESLDRNVYMKLLRVMNAMLCIIRGTHSWKHNAKNIVWYPFINSYDDLEDYDYMFDPLHLCNPDKLLN